MEGPCSRIDKRASVRAYVCMHMMQHMCFSTFNRLAVENEKNI